MSERYLLGDWGTTNLRLYLMEGDRVADVRQGPGIGGLKQPPATVLNTLIEEWLGREIPIDVVLCGMASSRTGLLELPYVKAPANFATWAQASRCIQVGSARVLVATGLQCGDDQHGFDVMRGEEAQIFGALETQPALADGRHFFVLPGTHSKWVEVVQGSIVQFRTALTGELYALLREHSTLLPAGATGTRDLEFDQGFAAGSQRSLAADEGLLTAIFKTRTAQLLQQRSPTWASGFLSCVLIGDELTTMSRAFDLAGSTVALIGDAQLAALYERAFAARGVTTRLLSGEATVLASMRHLWEQRAQTLEKAI